MADRDMVIKGMRCCIKKEQEPEEPAKRCGSCKWLRDPEFTCVCVNGDSPNVADFMDRDDSCEYWEAKEDAGK